MADEGGGVAGRALGDLEARERLLDGVLQGEGEVLRLALGGGAGLVRGRHDDGSMVSRRRCGVAQRLNL
jgi:hypothetical protein